MKELNVATGLENGSVIVAKNGKNTENGEHSYIHVYINKTFLNLNVFILFLFQIRRSVSVVFVIAMHKSKVISTSNIN